MDTQKLLNKFSVLRIIEDKKEYILIANFSWILRSYL
jgi:hypothetical protein